MIIIFAIVPVMKYLHNQNIIHGNLSTKNIFLNKIFHPKLFKSVNTNYTNYTGKPIITNIQKSA